MVSNNIKTNWLLQRQHDVAFNGFPAANTTYTVVSATAVGSPPLTNIVVAGGSPEGIPSDATADGRIGINYEFQLTVDGGTSTIGPIEWASIGDTVSDLISSINTALTAVLGAGEASALFYGGNIRIDSARATDGSPVPTISITNGTVATTDLFDTNNLVVDGFASFVTTTAATWGYIESDGSGNNATSGSAAASVEFNATTLGTDIIEFLVV